jgi:hypothetical protein
MILENHGIKVEIGYDSFWLDEGELYWKLKPYFDKWKVKETVVSKFSAIEEDSASLLVFSSPWANGYPMPDIDNGFMKTTYDDTAYCNVCGMGLVQKEPFRLKTLPKWSGHKKIFSLNWVYDELFIHKEFYESYFKPMGIECMDVLLYRKDIIIEDTVQLIIPESGSSLMIEGYSFEVCKSCGRKRYDLINRGFFPPFKERQSVLNIFKSKEWFGTGANARKYIFINQSIRTELIDLKLKAGYIPCKEL